MTRAPKLRILALVLGCALWARADLAPPELAEITLELTVDGQESLPLLRFFVTNCREPMESSVLERDKPLVCNPKKGPVRIFGFREGDLTELFALTRSGAGREESAAFLAKKAKTCGEVSEQDRTFLAKTNVTWVGARYEIEPGPKGGCRLSRISATTKTRAQFQASSAPAPTPSSKPADPPAAPSAKPADPAPAPPAPAPPAKSDCACHASPAPVSLPSLAGIAMAMAALALRRRAR